MTDLELICLTIFGCVFVISVALGGGLKTEIIKII